jgi:hypothetical protein
MAVFKSIISIAALRAAVALETTVDLSYAKYQGVSLPNGVTQWLGNVFCSIDNAFTNVP